MSLNIHVVYVRPQQVLNGRIVDKKDATIHEIANSSIEMRIIEDSSIPTTSGNPTIKDYLEAEASENYKLQHMDNYIIVTYEE